MVSLLQSAAILLLLSLNTANAATLSVKLTDPSVELGKGLNVEIAYLGKETVGQANLQPWERDFYIDRRRSAIKELSAGQTQTIETVRLYPRRAGTLTLFSLALGGAISEPVDLKVERALRNNIDGTPVWQKLPTQIWQGETVSNCVEMPLFDSRNNMKLELPEFDTLRVANWDAERVENRSPSLARQCWQLTASRPGIHELELPAVIQRGRGSWSFYLPKQTIEVLPLPSYLPPALPIGEPSVQTSLRHKQWQLRLQLSDPQAVEAYGVRASLAELSGVDNDEVSVHFETESRTLQQVQLFTAPVPAWSWGLGSGEKINLRYFDTRLGMLMVKEVSLPLAWNTPNGLSALLTSVLLLLALLHGRRAFEVWKRALERRKLKQAIGNCTTPEQLRLLLLQQTGSKTLESWANQSGIEHAQQIAGQLNALCFSANIGDSFSELKATLFKQF